MAAAPHTSSETAVFALPPHKERDSFLIPTLRNTYVHVILSSMREQITFESLFQTP